MEDKSVKRFGESEVVTVIKQEEPSPITSSHIIGSTPARRKSQAYPNSYCSQPMRRLSDGPTVPPECDTDHPDCKCNDNIHMLHGTIISKSSSGDVGKIIKERELELEQEFKQQLNSEIAALKEKFDYILQNEEVRTAYKLREVRRDCYEKIRALQNQLECKNAANLMYVMASERRKGKMAMLQMKEEYTNYIKSLKTLLIEGQEIILHLSRGYKTAARVDTEWRTKIKTILKENFLMKFLDTADETQCQYYFNEPQLLAIKAPLQIDPKENLCEDEFLEPLGTFNLSLKDEKERPWWQRLGDGNERPFVVYGDVGEFKAPERREVLRQLRMNKNKQAPKAWKEYLFNDMFIKSECENWKEMKDKYRGVPVIPTACLEMLNLPTTDPASKVDSISPSHNHDHYNRKPLLSIDTKAKMGSILKLITATCTGSEPVTKTILLGAKDSVELASRSKMKEKRIDSNSKRNEAVKLNVGENRRISTIRGLSEEKQEYEYLKPASSANLISYSQMSQGPEETKGNEKDQNDDDDSLKDMPTSLLGSLHRDSIEVVQHLPGIDSKIAQEKYCPVEECKLMQMDSFTRGLPSYMKASPYMIYEQSFDNYQPCTPEQLQHLRERIESKAQKAGRRTAPYKQEPTKEWEEDHNVGTQTNWSSEDIAIPCSCPMPSPTPQTPGTPGYLYNAEDLMSAKQLIDHVTLDCLYDARIEKNRFELVGDKLPEYDRRRAKEYCQNTADRVEDIKRILEENPSLLSIFQGHTY